MFSCLLLRLFSLVFCSYYSDVSRCPSAYAYNLLGICYIEPVALFPFVLENSQPSSLRVSTAYRLSCAVRLCPLPRAAFLLLSVSEDASSHCQVYLELYSDGAFFVWLVCKSAGSLLFPTVTCRLAPLTILQRVVCVLICVLTVAMGSSLSPEKMTCGRQDCAPLPGSGEGLWTVQVPEVATAHERLVHASSPLRSVLPHLCQDQAWGLVSAGDSASPGELDVLRNPKHLSVPGPAGRQQCGTVGIVGGAAWRGLGAQGSGWTR